MHGRRRDIEIKERNGGKVCVGRLLSKAADVKGLTDGGQSGDRQAVYTIRKASL